jgi:hypothetical protein
VLPGTAAPETDVKIEEEEDVKDVLEGDELDDDDTEVKNEDDEQDDDEDGDDDEDDDDEDDDDKNDDDDEDDDDIEENDDGEDMHETTKRGTYTVLVDSRVNMQILSSTRVPFTLTTVQVPNLPLTHTKRITVYLLFLNCSEEKGCMGGVRGGGRGEGTCTLCYFTYLLGEGVGGGRGTMPLVKDIARLKTITYRAI